MKRLDEILARCEAATPGTDLVDRIYDHLSVLRNRGTEKDTRAIIELTLNCLKEQFSHARTDLPLVVQALKKAVGTLQDSKQLITDGWSVKARDGIHETLAEIGRLLGEPPVQSPQGSEGEEK